jgi:beta-galactosidase
MSGGKPWMLLECAPSSVNWGKINKLKRPDAHRQEVLQAIANGASTVHYFQWRKSRGGFEKYHGAVVDHEGSNRSRVFQDCAAIGAELKTLSPLVAGDCPRADVALLYDWESRWALNFSSGPKKTEGQGPFPSDLYTETAFDHYEALTSVGLSVDILSTKSDFSAYKVLVLPALYLVTEDLAAHIRDFVLAGGYVVGTYLSAYVDASNRCHVKGFPGAGLREVFGVWNEELDNLHDETCVAVEGAIKGQARDVVERLHLEGAKNLAQAGSEFYAGQSLVTEHHFGDGCAAYLAARLEMSALKAFYARILKNCGLVRSLDLDLPEGVVFRKRESSKGTLGFLFNYSRKSRAINFGSQHFEKYGEPGMLLSGEFELAAYASLILRL